MKLLNDDFLVVENQFGTLNTMALRIGHYADPEYTPRGKIHPLFFDEWNSCSFWNSVSAHGG
jgi:hypothetical protein